MKVPSTVLTGLVANKIYPDPYSGLNNMLIPDASDEFNKKYNLEQFSYSSQIIQIHGKTHTGIVQHLMFPLQIRDVISS